MSTLRGFVQNSFPDTDLLTDCHRIFLRQIIARQCVPRHQARQILQDILDTYEHCTHGRRNLSLHSVVEDLNKALNVVRFRIALVRGEADGQVYVIFCNDEGSNVELAQGGTNVLSTVFRVVFHYLTTSSDPLTYGQAIQLRTSAQQLLTELGNDPTNTRTQTTTNTNQDGKEGGNTGSARSVTVKQWNDSLEVLIHQQWLTVQDNEIFMGPRATAELKPRISSTVGVCALCHAPCVTADRKLLDTKQERKHIACANGTLEKQLHDKEILVPQPKGNGNEEEEEAYTQTTATTLKSSAKKSGAKKSGSKRRRSRGKRAADSEDDEEEDEQEEEEEEEEKEVMNDEEEDEQPATQRRGRRK